MNKAHPVSMGAGLSMIVPKDLVHNYLVMGYNKNMFPQEDYLLKAMMACNFRMIGLMQNLSTVYLSEMAKRTEQNFEKALEISKVLNEAAEKIAAIQGDDPVSAGHVDEMTM